MFVTPNNPDVKYSASNRESMISAMSAQVQVIANQQEQEVHQQQQQQQPLDVYEDSNYDYGHLQQQQFYQPEFEQSLFEREQPDRVQHVQYAEEYNHLHLDQQDHQQLLSVLFPQEQGSSLDSSIGGGGVYAEEEMVQQVSKGAGELVDLRIARANGTADGYKHAFGHFLASLHGELGIAPRFQGQMRDDRQSYGRVTSTFVGHRQPRVADLHSSYTRSSRATEQKLSQNHYYNSVYHGGPNAVIHPNSNLPSSSPMYHGCNGGSVYPTTLQQYYTTSPELGQQQQQQTNNINTSVAGNHNMWPTVFSQDSAGVGYFQSSAASNDKQQLQLPDFDQRFGPQTSSTAYTAASSSGLSAESYLATTAGVPPLHHQLSSLSVNSDSGGPDPSFPWATGTRSQAYPNMDGPISYMHQQTDRGLSGATFPAASTLKALASGLSSSSSGDLYKDPLFHRVPFSANPPAFAGSSGAGGKVETATKISTRKRKVNGEIEVKPELKRMKQVIPSKQNYSDYHHTSGSILNHGSVNSAFAYPSLSITHMAPYYDDLKSESSQESINNSHILSLASANNNNNSSNNNNYIGNKDRSSVNYKNLIPFP